MRAGATAVGAETPEIVPRILAKRAVSEDVARRLIGLGDWWRNRYLPMFGTLYQPPPTLEINPSPGNRDSGVTTVTEKSLGAHAKFGTTGLCGVFDYAEVISGPGFVFMDTPGTDQVSWTGLMAGGAQVGVFTTGLGSCLGSGIMSTIKVAATTELYARMQGDMDVNAGRILDGTAGVPEVGREIYDLILDVAAGRFTRSERLGYGWHEFAPWFWGRGRNAVCWPGRHTLVLDRVNILLHLLWNSTPPHSMMSSRNGTLRQRLTGFVKRARNERKASTTVKTPSA